MKTGKDDEIFWVNLTRLRKVKVESKWVSCVLNINVLSLMS